MSHDVTASPARVNLIALSWLSGPRRCPSCPSSCRAGAASHTASAGCLAQDPKLLPPGTGLVLRFVVWEAGGDICLTLFHQMGKLHQRDCFFLLIICDFFFFWTETFPVFFAKMYFMTILLCRLLPLWTLHRVMQHLQSVEQIPLDFFISEHAFVSLRPVLALQ